MMRFTDFHLFALNSLLDKPRSGCAFLKMLPIFIEKKKLTKQSLLLHICLFQSFQPYHRVFISKGSLE